jgi:hypothetical protein
MMTPDLLPGIELAEQFAIHKVPSLAHVRHEWCEACDAAHDQEPRQFAHSHHLPGVICWARASTDLPVEHQLGIGLHEYGHVLAGDQGSEFDDEGAADEAVLKRFGVEIKYVGPHELQWVDLEDIG